MGDLSIFSKRLKEARIQCGMKQNELAKAIDVSAQTISMYEKNEKDGKGKNPTLDNALAIADKLNVSLDWLCGRDHIDAAKKQDKTMGDIVRAIVLMCDNLDDIVIENVAKSVSVVDPDTGYPRFDKVDVSYPGLVFEGGEISEFIEEWSKIKKLHDTDTIDDELYSLWLEKHFSSLDVLPVKRNNNPIDFDGELPF